MPTRTRKRPALKPRSYTIIPACNDEDIRIGKAMLPDNPSQEMLCEVVAPHLDHQPWLRIATLSDGDPGDVYPGEMYVDLFAVSKDLPRNERATGIVRGNAHLRSNLAIGPQYIAGTAILFEECDLSR